MKWIPGRRMKNLFYLEKTLLKHRPLLIYVGSQFWMPTVEISTWSFKKTLLAQVPHWFQLLPLVQRQYTGVQVAFYGFGWSGPRCFLLFIWTKWFWVKVKLALKMLQTLPTCWNTSNQQLEKLDYTSPLDDFLSECCLLQDNCTVTVSAISSPMNDFNAPLYTYTSLVPEHVQTSIYSWYSHIAWMHFTFTF